MSFVEIIDWRSCWRIVLNNTLKHIVKVNYDAHVSFCWYKMELFIFIKWIHHWCLIENLSQECTCCHIDIFFFNVLQWKIIQTVNIEQVQQRKNNLQEKWFIWQFTVDKHKFDEFIFSFLHSVTSHNFIFSLHSYLSMFSFQFIIGIYWITKIFLHQNTLWEILSSLNSLNQTFSK